MLLVPTYLSSSSVHGIGVFAAAPIPKGTLMWEFVDGIDYILSDAQVAAMPPKAQEFALEYGYYCPHFPGGLVMSSDNSRYLNHSDTPNTENSTDKAYALRDIAAHEEITCDYMDLCEQYIELPYVRTGTR